MDNATPTPLDNLSDEELCHLCQAGNDAAERALLRRYMPAIYWLPRQMFGAEEEDLASFLLFALEKIRERDIIARFDAKRKTRFATWFGVVLQRLYLDFLRQRFRRCLPTTIELCDADAAAPLTAEADGGNQKKAEVFLAQMHVRCRALFKLLLCHTVSLTPDEIRWIAETSARSVLEVIKEIARLEERLRNAEAKVKAFYDKLASAWWWKQQCELRLRGCSGQMQGARKTEEKARLERYQRQYNRLKEDVARSARQVTAPYRELAQLLNMKEETLGSHISRCRANALALLGKQRGRGQMTVEGRPCD